MKDKKEFFIGWKEEMPKSTSVFIKKSMLFVGLIIVLLGVTIVSFQKPFAPFNFRLGTIQEFTGIYHSSPVPILQVPTSFLPNGISNSILLVGYGKFGAEGIIQDIENKFSDLEGKKITLRGTLIHGDGKSVLELTEKEKSLVQIHNFDSEKILKSERPDKEISLTGEILDPKCYFGVMKPGEGKIHKSCAIRCISGGIPPVFRSIENGIKHYYIILDSNGQKMNDDLLSYVAEKVTISGKVNHHNGWDVLYAETSNILIIE